MWTLPLPRPLLRLPQPHALAARPCITDLPRRFCGSIASSSTRTWSGRQIRAQRNTSHELPVLPLLARTLTVLCCGLCLQTGLCGAYAPDITQSPSGGRCLATLFWPAWDLLPSSNLTCVLEQAEPGLANSQRHQCRARPREQAQSCGCQRRLMRLQTAHNLSR